jgi:hypothetical protein
VVDHFSRGALTRYLDYIGKPLRQALGDEYGRTVDTFFCDSFEVSTLPNTLLWSNDTLAGFRTRKGYEPAHGSSGRGIRLPAPVGKPSAMI